MDDISQGQVEEKILLQDEYFFKYIFKKTEKISSAVFYIVNKRQDIPLDNVVRADLERRAKDTHSVVLSLLNMGSDTAQYGLKTLLHSLVSLDSVLRLFAAMGGISEDNRIVISNEIDGVQRSMRRYLGNQSFSLLDFEQTHTPTKQRSVAAKSRAETLTSGATSQSHAGQPANYATDRQGQILSLLRDNDGVSIKDIHGVINDCSEKTIQRELLSLIENGKVRREGERRWSRYFLI